MTKKTANDTKAKWLNATQDHFNLTNKGTIHDKAKLKSPNTMPYVSK